MLEAFKNPRRSWTAVTETPFALIGTVAVVWLLVSLSFVFKAMDDDARLSDWTSGANCTLLAAIRASECLDGPGAGGVGYKYEALAEAAQCGNESVVAHSEAFCGMETLAGRDWFTKSIASATLQQPATPVTLPCYVKDACTSFEFKPVYQAKKQEATATYYIGVVLLLPLCALASVFAILSLFFCVGAKDGTPAGYHHTPENATQANEDPGEEWRRSARHSIHVASRRGRAETLTKTRQWD